MLAARPASSPLTAIISLALALGACGRDHEPSPATDQDRAQNALVAVDEGAIRARVEGQELRLTVPVQRVTSKGVATELKLELVPVVGDGVLDAGPLRVDLTKQSQGEFEASLHLPQAIVEQAELVAFNVHIHDGENGGLSVTRSAFSALPRYEVRLEGPARMSAGKNVSYRVRAHDPKSFAPVPGAPVVLLLKRGDAEAKRLSAQTDARGDAFFELSLDDAGDYQISAQAESCGTHADVEQAVNVESGGSRLLLTTDKPIYQPGQNVHLRALSLRKGSNEPVAQVPVRFEILDGKGNKIFKRDLQSDAYGIASVEFRLGSVLNLGTFQVHAVVGDVDAQKTFEVSRYVLPKFALDTHLDKVWYRPADKVQGTVDARYFFGKHVSAGDVEITASSLDLGSNAFARVVGKTAADGRFPFEVALPRALVGLPLEQGQALVSLHVKVTDAAGQIVEKDVAVTVAAQAANVVLVPEATTLVPGVPNRVQVFVSDPGGGPVANASVQLKLDGNTDNVVTDAFGQAVAELTPEASSTGGILTTTTLPSLEVLSQTFTFGNQVGKEHVLVRTDRAVYDVGETVGIDITTTDPGRVYVDWLHEGQAVDQRTLETLEDNGRKAHFDFPLDTALAGNNRVEAYVVDNGGQVVRAGSTIFVREGGGLRIELATDKPQYEPGQPAKLTFSVTDAAGQPKVAALGVQIVDEAVFALVDAKPGLLRTYFELDDAFAEPHYQIGAPAGSVESLLFDDTRSDDQAKNAAAQERARASFAALGDMGVTGLHAGSWSATLQRMKTLLAPSLESEGKQLEAEVRRLVKRGQRWLASKGCSSQSYCENLGNSYASLLVDYVETHWGAADPWGRSYQVQPGYNTLSLLSRGPDEVNGTDDDCSVTVNAPTLPSLDVAAADGEFDDGDLDFAPEEHAGNPGNFGDAGISSPEPESGPSTGEPRVRREFPETLYVNPALITDPNGTATVEVPLADSITEWRVSSLANALDGTLGGGSHGVTVFQDFFVDIAFPAELTRGDEVTFPIALYNYLDEPQSVTVTLQASDWYTPIGATSTTVELAANAVQGVSFPVRVDDVGVHTLTAKAVGKQRSDAVERSVRVVADGKAFPAAQSGALGAGSQHLSVSYPNNAVPGSQELSLSVFPAFLSSVVSGMDTMLQAPYGCFEQTTSTTWPNVLVLRYMRDTQQITPEIELKAESYISAGYQRLLTYEHPTGGFSWFGTQDGHPYLSVTAFGVMEFADMAAVFEVDDAMLTRTITWLVGQQQGDGSWQGDQTEFFDFQTSLVRNTAFVVWALSSAGHQGDDIGRGLSYLRAHWNDDAKDAYTLAMVANAFASAAASDETLDSVLAALDGLKKVDGSKLSWDTGGTQTSFYGAGNDAAVTTTALVAHALLNAGAYPDLVKGAIESLVASRDQAGNFGSTQATIWTLKTLLLAARKGSSPALGDLSVLVDGQPLAQVPFTADQSDVLTTIDLASVATTGAHDVTLTFAGTGKLSYNLVSGYHLPWNQVPAQPAAPLAVGVSYDRTQLAVNDLARATVAITNQSGGRADMILVDVGIPPGFEVQTDDLDAYVSAHSLSKYELTPRQLILYVSSLETDEVRSFQYRLRATMPVKASDGGAEVYPYYEPARKSQAPGVTLVASE
ncbi:MAG: MG2 domain-containing protein [Myxococcales bacterium]